MKLKKLNLKNYRIHQDSTLDFGDSTFCIIRGKNMSGKSSFAEALSMNLANTTVSLSGDGKGFTKKIRTINGVCDGKAVITTEVQGKHLLKHTTTLNVNTSGRTSNTECLDEPDDNRIVNGFKNFLSDRRDAILIATQTDYFPRLDEEKQKNLLAKLVLPTRYDFPQDKVEATNIFLDTPINFDGGTFEIITYAYKKLYKERETTNRQESDLRKSIPDALPIPKGVDSEFLQTQLTEIRGQRTNLQTERDAAVQKSTEVEVKRGRLQTKIEGLRADVEKDKKRLTALETSLLSDEEVRELTAIVAKEEELEALNKQHSAYYGGMQVVSEQIKRLKEISEKGDSGATCPTCDQDIDTIKIGAMILDLEKEYAAADQEIQKLDAKIEAIGNLQGAVESLKIHVAAVKETDELEKSLAETVKQGKATKVELDALGEAVNATLPFNDPLSELQTAEDSIVDQLRPVMAAEERAKERERLTEQLKKLQAKAAKLDGLVKYYDKDGIKAELIGKYVGGFESKINTVLDAFGYKTSLSMDPFSLEVTTSRGYVGPVKELSGAEEHIFKVAFQCAVSIAAGINLVVIDEIEELGEDIRPALFGSVLSLIDKGSLEQAILIGFSLDKTLPPKEKRAPGTKWFYVENGTVEELK